MNECTITNSTLPYYSDKCILPQIFLQNFVQNHDEIPNPFIFKVRALNSNKVAYIGVREFTAAEHTVEIPGVVLEKLQSKVGDSVHLDYAPDVVKGDKLTLKSLGLSPRFLQNIVNVKFFLEANLSAQYTTLTQGETLKIATDSDLGDVLSFVIKLTSPSSTICIINTDLVFDLEPMDEEEAQTLLEKKSALMTKAGVSSNDKSLDFSTNISEFTMKNYNLKDVPIDFAYKSNEMAVIDISGGERGENMLLSAHGDRLAYFDVLVSTDQFVSPDSFIWSTAASSIKDGSKSVSFSLNDPSLANKEALYVIGHFWNSSMKSDVQITVNNVLGTKTLDQVSVAQNVCPNCGMEVNTNKVMHERFCFRNNVKCPKGCGQVFLKTIPETHWHCEDTYGNDLESYQMHLDLFHKSVEPQDAESLPGFESYVAMAHFKATEWVNKLHECQFCHLVLPRGESDDEDRLLNLSHHENKICGAKTSNCEICNKIVRVRNLKAHYKIHEFEKRERDKFEQENQCLNENCCNVIETADSSDDDMRLKLGLCKTCFAQFHSTLYDPEYKKLFARIERRYMIQLTRGCGKTFCKNMYCLSSGLAQKRTVSETLKFVQSELMTKVSKMDGNRDGVKYWFCVNESVTKKMMMQT